MPRESLENRKARATKIVRKLKKLYGEADCALNHKNAFELLIATILSAQSTDVNVNKVTPQLFKRYPTAQKLSKATLPAVEEIVRSTGFFRQKAKNIVGCAKQLVRDHDGEVPETIPQLTALPGVARKTANVVLGTWFGKNEGVVVDTHVGRIAHRLGLTWTSKDTKDAVKIEKDLMQVVSRRQWTFFSHSIIWHGRGVCPARTPRCDECELASLCPSADL
ncbi:MAG: endonuclease III [Planctomycetota bacterium]